MSFISLEKIEKRWGEVFALRRVDVSVEEGSFCVLLGPSGCGKSTTLRILAGLEQPTSGVVRIGGRDVTALPPAQRGIAMVFQNYALFPHLSVADNITFGLQVRKVPKAERAARLEKTARLLGLGDLLARKPGQLSGGQQQRVALGRALVAGARVCLMDEPLSNLDARLRQDMRRELRRLQQQLALTVIYVTHDQTEAMSMADQVVLLHQGQVEQADRARALYARPASTFAARFIGTPPMNLLRVEQGRVAGSRALIRAPSGASWVGVRPEAIQVCAPEAPGAVEATVAGSEYLGADGVLECSLGAQSVLVRTHGSMQTEAGAVVGLKWEADALHAFDSEERRMAA